MHMPAQIQLKPVKMVEIGPESAAHQRLQHGGLGPGAEHAGTAVQVERPRQVELAVGHKDHKAVAAMRRVADVVNRLLDPSAIVVGTVFLICETGVKPCQVSVI